MQTNLAAEFRDTREGREADAILRSCVHCGFCTATCPTYQLLGDELDGPRGRIYLIKQVLEGAAGRPRRRSCTSTAASPAATARRRVPSGVQYGRLVDIGRADRRAQGRAHARRGRAALDAAPGAAVEAAVRRRADDGPAGRRGCCRASSPTAFRGAQRRGAWPAPRHARKMLVMRRLRAAGAQAQHRRRDGARARPHRHLAAARGRRRLLRRAVASPRRRRRGARASSAATSTRGGRSCERGVEAIVVTASGCGVMVKDYGHFLAHDAAYAAKAKQDRRARARPDRDRRRRSGRRSRPRSRWTRGRSASRSTRRARCSTA